MAQAKKAAGRSVKQEGSPSSGKKAATVKKTAGTGRKATGKTASGNRNQKKQGRQSKNKKENAIAKEIWILLFFAASVILFLSVLNLAGQVGSVLRSVQFGLFGTLAYVFPFLLFWAICFMISNHNYPMAAMSKVLTGFFTFMICCGIVELFGGRSMKGTYNVAEYYHNSTSGLNGGLIGGFLFRFLEPKIGVIGAYVIFVVAAIAGIVFITERSVIKPLYRGSTKMAHAAKEDLGKLKEQQAAMSAQKKVRMEERRAEKERREAERQEARTKHECAGNFVIPREPERLEPGSGPELPASGAAGAEAFIPDPQTANSVDAFHGNIYISGSELVAPRDHRTLAELDELDAQIKREMDEEFTDSPKVEETTARPELIHADVNSEKMNITIAGTLAPEELSGEAVEIPEEKERKELQFTPFMSHSGEAKQESFEHGSEELETTGELAWEQPESSEFPETSEFGQQSKFESKIGTESAEAFEAADSVDDEFVDDPMAAYDVFDTPSPEAAIRQAKMPLTEAVPRTEPKKAASESIWRQGENKDGNSGVTFRGSGSAAASKPSVVPAPPVKKEYFLPPIRLLKQGTHKSGVKESELKATAMKLQQTLRNFGVGVTVTDISCGPSVTRYELQPEQGVKVSRIVSLADDIKLNLAAADIRIEAPIPGKAAVGIEVPNAENQTVYLRELLDSEEFKKFPSRLGFGVGRDIGGKVIVTDLARMPHLLIAGATGSGKSVCINTLIMSILYKAKPDEVKLIMIDPKVVELSVYNGIPHLLIPVVTDPKKAAGALNWAVAEMTDRYKKFAEMNVRDIKGYNHKVDEDDSGEYERMSQIVVIVDELADLMMVAASEVEESICRLAQLARAAGIHLVLATQRPSVNVITGLIKANIPSRIAFAVSSGVDSRTIIDMVGAEKLLGKGDMLFYPTGYPKPVRIQGAFVSDDEVSAVVDFLKGQTDGTAAVNKNLEMHLDSAGKDEGSVGAGERDEYFERCGRFLIEKGKASIGNLQRAFKIGFNRAARIMDQLADAGVVGPEEGTKARQILMTMEEFDALMAELNR